MREGVIDAKKRESLVVEAKKLDRRLSLFMALISQRRDTIAFLSGWVQSDAVRAQIQAEELIIRQCIEQCKQLGHRRAVIGLLLAISDN